MSPELEHQLGRIRDAVGRLDRLLEQKQQIIGRQQDEREGHVKETWHLRRDLAAVEKSRTDYEAVRDENLRLRDREVRLAEELRSLKAKVKALSEYIHR